MGNTKIAGVGHLLIGGLWTGICLLACMLRVRVLDR